MLSIQNLGRIAGGSLVSPQAMNYGIDVSHHNGVIDFAAVKAGGIVDSPHTFQKVDFVYIKMTNGSAGRDARCGFNAAECYRLGIPFGFYHYCTLSDKDEIRDATAEAEYAIKRLADLPPYLMPIALDVEDPGNVLTPEELEKWIETFYTVISAAKHDDYILYSYSPFLRTHLPKDHKLSHVRLWAARYGGFPASVPGWDQKFFMHQYSATGRVSGINGNVDLNKIL